MQVKELRLRYRLSSDQEVIQAIKENLEVLNQKGNHARFADGRWTVDDEAVKFLDTVFTYLGDEKTEKTAGSTDAEKTVKENAALHQQMKAMQKELKEAREAARNYAADFQEIQNKYLAMQEGQTETNTAMVRKAKARADQAEKELSRLNDRYASLEATSAQRIDELKAKVNELMDKLAQSNSVMEQRVKAEFDLLQSKKAEDKLYEQLQEGEKKTSELTAKLQQAKEGHQATLQSIDALKSDMQEWAALCQKLERQMTSRLQSLNTSEDAGETDARKPARIEAPAPIKAVKAEPRPALKEKPKKKALPAAKPAEPTATIAARKDLMETIRAEQEEREESSKRGFWHRVASFF